MVRKSGGGSESFTFEERCGERANKAVPRAGSVDRFDGEARQVRCLSIGCNHCTFGTQRHDDAEFFVRQGER